jgi:hypothetical protein
MTAKAADFWVITFPSVHHALRAEKVLAADGIAAALIPIPRELSGSCEGLAARLAEGDVAGAAAALAAAGVPMVKQGVRISGKSIWR